MTYSDTVKMTVEELRNSPEVELCTCGNRREIHRDCKCLGFAATGQRAKNSSISRPAEAKHLTPDISDLMASIVERHAGSVSRRALADDLTVLVNAERERCAKVADGYIPETTGHPLQLTPEDTIPGCIARKIRSGQ